jgi:hypothetical protein
MKLGLVIKRHEEKKFTLKDHQLSVWDEFYDQDRTKYTMSDITNMAEQIISGLIGFYLWNRFIHRDVKD